MSDLSIHLRISSVRSRGRAGGAIFAGTADDGRSYVAVCDYRLIPDANLPEKGQLWRISGIVSRQQTPGQGGYVVLEHRIHVDQAELLRPSGRNLVTWIADSPDCAGIGQVKAQKLYDRFGPELLEHIEQRRLSALTQIVSEESAQRLCDAFARFKVANVLHWLDQVGIPRKIGMSIVAYYGEAAQARIEANPYALISFEANWKQVDKLARSRFDIAQDDPRRLTSAIEEVLYNGMQQGHTGLPAKDVQTRLARLLTNPELATRAMKAPERLEDLPRPFQTIDGFCQPNGTYLIESYLAHRLRQMVVGEDETGQSGLFAQLVNDPISVDRIIADFEAAHTMPLSAEQKTAVQTSARAHLSLILGGAGTGKTTVLKVLYQALEALHPGIAIYQLALAGRAAQRMAEATGREAMTIAGFLTKVDSARIDIGAVVVVDEVSMVDAILMYRLLRHLPGGVRLVLVGDPSQLPPIGPGLVLHALAGLPVIPQTELKVVKRQSTQSGIPQVAAAIRASQLPAWVPYLGRADIGVSFVPCAPHQLEAKTLEIYEQLGGRGADFSVQILSITNSSIGGVKNLNTALHNRYRAQASRVSRHDPEFGMVGASTLNRDAICVDDLVIFTENDYALGLRNGSLGRIVRTLPLAKPDDPCCICEFEGTEYPLDSLQIQALNHAYAITVHKVQGSQFGRIIIPIHTSRLLDQALLYTVVTRGIEQVVLVGDEVAALAAIRAGASAARRHIALPKLLAATAQPIMTSTN